MVDYWLPVCSRALSETWDLVVNLPVQAFLAFLVILLIASVIQLAWLGRQIVKDQLKIFLTVMAAVLVTGVFIFVWKLLSTPPLINSEQRQEIKGLQDENAKLVKEIDKEKEINRPALHGRIETKLAGNLVKGWTELVILMSITNTGSPSIVEGYHLQIKTDTFEVATRPMVIPDGLDFLDNSGKSIKVINRNDALYEKTIQPIERGGLARGYLRFAVEGKRIDEIMTDKTILTVFFRDVLDKEYEAVNFLSGSEDVLMYYPGADSQVHSPRARTRTPGKSNR